MTPEIRSLGSLGPYRPISKPQATRAINRSPSNTNAVASALNSLRNRRQDPTNGLSCSIIVMAHPLYKVSSQQAEPQNPKLERQPQTLRLDPNRQRHHLQSQRRRVAPSKSATDHYLPVRQWSASTLIGKVNKSATSSVARRSSRNTSSVSTTASYSAE